MISFLHGNYLYQIGGRANSANLSFCTVTT
nr:MAG TPA: hypothetical protein [Caudoviricetes sp.]